MNFPFTEVDFAGEDASAPIIPSANGNQARSTNKKKGGLDTSQVTNSKVRINQLTLIKICVLDFQNSPNCKVTGNFGQFSSQLSKSIVVHMYI